MKRNTKWMGLMLSMALLMSTSACSDAPAAEETTVTTVEETTTVETTEVTTSEEVIETTEELIETEIEVVDDRDTKANEWFTLLKNKASELHGSDDSMLFGFVDVYTTDTLFKLITYTTDEGYKYYCVEDDEVTEVENNSQDFGLDEYGPESFLMPYEEFMDFPGFVDFTGISFIDRDAFDMAVYNNELSDGYYSGTLYGFSKDCTYAYMCVGRMADVNLSAEECLALEEGDVVKVNGESMNVSYVEQDFDYAGQTRIALGDIDEGGKFIIIDSDDEGNISKFIVLNMWGHTDGEDYHFVKVPVSMDAKLIVDDSVIATGDLQEYLSGNASTDDSYAEYTDGGFTFYVGTHVGMGGNPFLVENGNIASLEFYT